MKGMKLRTKLIVGGLIMVIVPLMAIGAFSVHWASKAMEELENNQLLALRKVVADQVRSMLEEQSLLLMNAPSHDSVVQNILKTGYETGIYNLAQFILDNFTTSFHDKDMDEIFS